MKQYKKEEIKKVKCDFCGKEIECPEDMLDSDKHTCFECFKGLEGKMPKDEIARVHVDIPTEKMDEIMPDMMIEQVVNEALPHIWKEHKSKFKEMSKKEAVEHAFAAGAAAMLNLIDHLNKEGEKLENGK